jgi:hypothetical protein
MMNLQFAVVEVVIKKSLETVGGKLDVCYVEDADHFVAC